MLHIKLKLCKCKRNTVLKDRYIDWFRGITLLLTRNQATKLFLTLSAFFQIFLMRCSTVVFVQNYKKSP